MKTIGELQLLPVWVNPNHRVSSARILLAGHRARALGVIEGGLLVGTISFEELAVAPESDDVARYVRPLGMVLSPDENVRDVAARMAAEGLDYMPVADRGKFVGILTATMLLRDVSRSWDPLTGLSWSDALRDWGIQQLREGHEVTILFIDLDDFGLYNKRYGHIIGDRVLVQVARYLGQCIEEETDVLVRYGGDEFAIATIRSRRETENLQSEIERGLQGTTVADADQPVTFSVGIFGGRRTRERENIHYSATLDSLINMASRAAQASKVAKRKSEEPAAAPVQSQEERTLEPVVHPASSPDIAVVEVFSSGEGSGAMETVILTQNDRVVSGVCIRSSLTRVESVVHATAKALSRLREDVAFEFDHVQLTEEEDGRKVEVFGRLMVAGSPRNVTAVRAVGEDLFKSVSEATIEAALS